MRIIPLPANVTFFLSGDGAMAQAEDYSRPSGCAKRIRRCLAGLARLRSPSTDKILDETSPIELRAQSLVHAGPRRALPDWLQDEGVQGLGLGAKITSGVARDQLALRVYVNSKRERGRIDHPVPRQLTMGLDAPVDTDVIPVGDIRPQALTERLRPIQPGCSLGHIAVEGGTLGCIVRKNDGSPQRYVLSNSHVLAACGLAKVGDVIIQPALADGGRKRADRIAMLREFVPFDYSGDGFSNEVDAAIAEIDGPDIAFQIAMPQTGQPPGKITKSVRVGMKVQKTGRSTGHSWGKVIDTDFHAIVPYADPANPGRQVRVLFRDQVLCTRFTDFGDSGALVLSSNGRVVGLHFAGGEEVSVFNRISRVFDLLRIELDNGDG